MIDIRHFEKNGVVIIPDAVSESDLERMSEAFSDRHRSRHSGLSGELMDWLSSNDLLLSLASKLLGTPAHLVRVLALDKTAEDNWFVPWHQDRAIAVAAPAAVKGYANWTFKDGVHHVEPPATLLEKIVTLRVHLDDCGRDQGPLEIIPASHQLGRLEKAEINKLACDGQEIVTLARRGSIVAMRPLIIHRSKKARSKARRRVLHLEFTAAELPEPLLWAIYKRAD